MTTITKRFKCGAGVLALLFLGVVAPAFAQQGPALIYVKNNFPNHAYVWVNGDFQGLATAGRVSFMPVEGFVTRDSGIQPDGELVIKHAYGGWDPRGRDTIDVTVAAWSDEKDDEGNPVLVKRDIKDVGVVYNPGTSSRGAGVWIGGPPKLERVELEFAEHIREARIPLDLRAAMPKAVNTPPETFTAAQGGIGGGANFIAKWSGKDAGEEEEAQGESVSPKATFSPNSIRISYYGEASYRRVNFENTNNVPVVVTFRYTGNQMVGNRSPVSNETTVNLAAEGSGGYGGHSVAVQSAQVIRVVER
ncbi:MAG: hypothetical protein JJT75_08225 [Opitutales bacterium]|nr:hypothetical protein [Opitutales bacterium]MCH8539754.1 hypothetical protein [Opitutales bacterium]